MGFKIVRFNREEHGKPGWEPRPDLGAAFGNPKYGLVLHVAYVDEETGEFKFDGILRVEPGGGVFLPIDEQGRVGLQLRKRPQVRDMDRHREDWPHVDLDENLWRESWEVPRGFADVKDSGEVEDADATVEREGEEEMESRIVAATKLIDCCDNTASAPHFTRCRIGYVDQTRKPERDPHDEELGKLTWFTPDELRELINDGTLYCNFTLAAIGAWLLLYNGTDVETAARNLAEHLDA